MSQATVLAGLEALSPSQAINDFSKLSGPNGERFSVIKESGPGFTGNLQNLFNDLVGLTTSEQQAIYDSFNDTNQVMGGRPCKGQK